MSRSWPRDRRRPRREAFYAALLDDDAERLYERAPCGYLSTTPDGTIIKVNETFLDLTGYRSATSWSGGGPSPSC